MGANMQRQAVPLLKPESPIVGTVLNTVLRKTQCCYRICHRWLCTYADASKITVTAKPEHSYTLKQRIYDAEKPFTYEIAKTLKVTVW
jgi:DNA-directed RNA polymerase subunit beta